MKNKIQYIIDNHNEIYNQVDFNCSKFNNKIRSIKSPNEIINSLNEFIPLNIDLNAPLYYNLR